MVRGEVYNHLPQPSIIMDKIQIKINYSWQDLDQDMKRARVRILENPSMPVKDIYAIMRGGLVPGVYLSHLLDLPMLKNKRDISNHTLVVDDICDSGRTMIKFLSELEVKPWTLSIFHKPSSEFEPNIWLRRTVNWQIFPWESLKSSKYDSTDI